MLLCGHFPTLKSWFADIFNFFSCLINFIGKNKDQEHIFMCQKINKQDKKVYTQDLNTTNLRRNRNALFMLRKKIKKRDNLYRKMKMKKYNEHKNA